MAERAEKSPLESTLVKVSGDLVEHEAFYEWLREIADSTNRLVVLCGGGSEITARLNREGIPFNFDPQGSRVIDSFKGREVAAEVLYCQRMTVEKKLKENGIEADVIEPLLKTDSGPLHMNGDPAVKALYPNFGKIYVVTKQGTDKSELESLDRVKVVYL